MADLNDSSPAPESQNGSGSPFQGTAGEGYEAQAPFQGTAGEGYEVAAPPSPTEGMDWKALDAYFHSPEVAKRNEEPSDEQLARIVQGQQAESDRRGWGQSAMDFVKGIPKGAYGILMQAGEGLNELADAAGNGQLKRLPATAGETVLHGLDENFAEPVEKTYENIRNVGSEMAGGFDPKVRLQMGKQTYLDRLRRERASQAGTFDPLLPDDYKSLPKVVSAVSPFVSLPGVGEFAGAAVKALKGEKALTTLRTVEDAEKVLQADKSLSRAAAGKVGTGVSAAGKLAEKTGTLPANIWEAAKKKIFGEGESAQEAAEAAAKAGHAFENGLAMAGLVTGHPHVSWVAGMARGLEEGGKLTNKAGQFVKALADTTPDTIKPRLWQIAANPNPETPGWLRNFAMALDRTGIGGATKMGVDLAKGAAHGAAIGGVLGALTADNPEQAGEMTGGGAMIGPAGTALSKITGADAAARNARQDLMDWARFVRQLSDDKTSPYVLEKIQNDPAQLAKANLASQFYALNRDKIGYKFVDDATYRSTPGIDPNTAGNMTRDPKTGKPIVTINVDSESNKIPHEIVHAIQKALGIDDQELRLRITSALSADPAEAKRIVDAQKQRYAYLTLTGKETPEATYAARDAFKALPADEQQRQISAIADAEDKRLGPNWVYGEMAADAGEGELERLGYDLRRVIRPRWKSIGDDIREKFLSRVLKRGTYAPKDALFSDARVYGPEMRRIIYDQIRQFTKPDPSNKAGFENRSRTVNVAKQGSGKGVKGSDPLPMELNPKTGLLENEWGVRDPKSPEKFLPFAEKVLKKNEKLRQQEVNTNFVEGKPVLPVGDTSPDMQPRTTPSGKVEVSGTKIYDKLKNLATFSEHAKRIAKMAEDLIGSGRTMEGFYQAVEHSEERKAAGYDPGVGNIPVSWAEFAPYDFHTSSKGNVLIRGPGIMDTHLRKARMIAEQHPVLAPWLASGDWKQFDANLNTYLKNIFDNVPGESNGLGVEKKNALNAFVFGDNKQFRDRNPMRAYLKSKADKKGILRSFRVDRMGDFNPGKTEGYFYNYNRGPHNLSPQPERGPVDDQRASELFRRMRETANNAPEMKPGNRPLPSRQDAEENYRNGQLNRAVGLAGRFSLQSERGNLFETHEKSRHADEDTREDENTRRAERYFDIGHNLKSHVWAWLDDRLQTGKGTSHGREFGHDRADMTFKGWYDPDENVVSFVSPDREPVRSVDEIPDRVYRQIVNKFGKDVRFQFFPPESTERYSPQPEGEANKAEREEPIKPGPVWHSALEKTIEAKMPGKAPVQMVRNIIDPAKSPGVKADEVNWTGLSDFLANKTGVITKQEVLDYLKENAVKLVEKAPKTDDAEKVNFDNGERREPDDSYVAEMAQEYYRNELREVKEEYADDESMTEDDLEEKARERAHEIAYRSAMEDADKEYYDRTHGLRIVEDYNGSYELHSENGSYIERFDSWDEAEEAAQEYANGTFGNGSEGTVHDRWQLGGPQKEYKELLFTLPDHPDGPEAFKEEAHWDDGNPVAHARFNTREIDGKKTLFVEEIQSDWHQKGRKYGYRSEVEPYSADDLIYDKHPNGSYTANYPDGVFAGYASPETVKSLRDRYSHLGELGAVKHELEFKLKDVNEKRQRDAAPDAPWRSTWAEMVFRRMLRYAAEHGYDQIAWTTGDQQNERYSLAKHVTRIEYRKVKPGIYSFAAFNDGGKVTEQVGITAKKLSEYVGGELAAKMVQAADTRFDKENGESLRRFGAPIYGLGHIDDLSRAEFRNFFKDEPELELSGSDLEIGGSGMRKFYDQMLPSYANKLGKKFGAKVKDQPVRLGGGREYEVYHPSTGEVVGAFDDYAKAVSEADNWNAHNEHKLDVRSMPKTDTVHSMPITPEMRKSVVGEGMPRYSPQPEKAPEPHDEMKRDMESLKSAANFVRQKLFDEGALTSDVEYALEKLPPSSSSQADIESALWSAGEKRNWKEILEDEGDRGHDFEQNSDPFVMAKQNHGLTDDPEEAGYVLPSGEMLDFSGKRNGGSAGTRAEDHRQIQYPDRPSEGYDAMTKFMDFGAVRVDGKSGAIDLRKAPTSEQLSRIRQIGETAGQIVCDLVDGDRKAAFETDDAKRAVGLIQRFYRGQDLGSADISQRHSPQAELAAPDKNTPSEPGYLYHATNVDNARDIAGAKLNVHRPDHGTDQDVWPDGERTKRAYFTAKAGSAWQFAPEDGKAALIRVKRDSHPFKEERGTGDVFTTQPVPSKKIEVLTSEGWKPIDSLKQSDSEQGEARHAPQSDKPIKLYRGTWTGNKEGSFYHEDKEFARQFTQSGRDNEIKAITLRPSEIYRADPLPYGGDPDALESTIAEAIKKGFKAVYADEGGDYKPSVIVITARNRQPKAKH